MNNSIKKFKEGNTFIKIYPLTALQCSIQKIEFRVNQIKKYIDIGFDFNIDSNYLDYIHSENMFHGDIHYRNLMIKDEKIVLIDWEPCFIQRINNKKIIKSHSNGLHAFDKKNKNISKLTDKKGYLNLLKDVLNIKEELNLCDSFLINSKCIDIFSFINSHLR